MDAVGDMHFVKLFKISQLSIEYLLYTQSYLDSLSKALDMHYKSTYEMTQAREDHLRRYKSELTTLKKELKMKQKTLATYECLLKLPPEVETNVTKCPYCHKFFVARKYLRSHYERHHPDKQYEEDFGDEDRLARTLSP